MPNHTVRVRSVLGIRGFTLPEVMVVMGVIAVLLAVLLPALSGSLRMGDMTKSLSRMKQISTWMTLYSNDNRDHIVPSQFNYQDPANPSLPLANYPIKVRSNSNHLGGFSPPRTYKGTWTDILWTYADLGKTFAAEYAMTAADDSYRFDSPDVDVYESNPDYEENPFRAGAPNTHNFINADGSGPTPFCNAGAGAREKGLPGYFAANNFFNADRDADPLANPGGTPDPIPTPANGRWYTNGQIKAPDRSMYLVDSLAGETINPEVEPYDNITVNAEGFPLHLEVDFRYSGVCLMMFLDGHTSPEGPWTDMADLQDNRHIKVQNLHKN